MKYIFIFIFILAYVSAWAQSADPGHAQADSLKSSYLNEVVVSANKIHETRRNVGQQVSVINPAILRNFNAQTAADLIQNTGFVSMQRSQQGGGSPMLRGFEASRVLMMMDGVRLNNLIYRSGHLQNIITVDNNMLDRAEVLFGPSSTVYGSDALGGVIHFYTRNPGFSTSGNFDAGGNAFLRFGTANREKSGHLDLNLGGQRFASLISFTYSDFGDLKMGEKTNPSLGEPFGLRPQYVERSSDNTSDMLIPNSDPLKQINSGYKQWDLLQKFLFKKSERASHLLNFQYSNSTNVPRYDRLTDPNGSGGLSSAEWYYGPQRRVLTSYQLKVDDLGSLADAMTATVSFQDIEESRHNRNFGSNNKTSRIENVNVGGLTIDFQKKLGKLSLRYGIDGQFNSLKSTAFSTDIMTGVQSPQTTRYPDGNNRMNMMAFYSSNTFELSPLLSLNYGARAGGSWLYSTFKDKTFYPFPFDEVKQNNVVASSFAGIVFTPTSWKLSFTGSSGYRAPNIDDLSKVFDTAPGSVIVPNPDLGPEQTINGDLGITRFLGSILRVEGNFFVTQFTNAIVTLPSTFQGQPTIIYDGVPSQVLANQNKGKAYIYGSSLALRSDISKNIVATATYNYTYGRAKNEFSTETPLDHIAPAFGRVGIQYNNAKLKSELFSNFSAWKRSDDFSSSVEDNAIYAPRYGTPAFKGMPSWYTINLRVACEITKMFTLQAGIDNILDLQYRTFASGINSPGRNIFGTLRVKF